MPPTRKNRVYARKRGGTARYYGDFRDFADGGGGLEALIPPDEHRATGNADIAAKLANDRLVELKAKRENRSSSA